MSTTNSEWIDIPIAPGMIYTPNISFTGWVSNHGEFEGLGTIDIEYIGFEILKNGRYYHHLKITHYRSVFTNGKRVLTYQPNSQKKNGVCRWEFKDKPQRVKYLVEANENGNPDLLPDGEYKYVLDGDGNKQIMVDDPQHLCYTNVASKLLPPKLTQAEKEALTDVQKIGMMDEILNNPFWDQIEEDIRTNLIIQ